MKSVQIRGFCWSVFPVFSQNTGKYGPEENPYLDTFHAVLCLHTILSASVYLLQKHSGHVMGYWPSPAKVSPPKKKIGNPPFFMCDDLSFIKTSQKNFKTFQKNVLIPRMAKFSFSYSKFSFSYSRETYIDCSYIVLNVFEKKLFKRVIYYLLFVLNLKSF